MHYFLFKSEPSCWSWEDQTRTQTTTWDGVRNHQAQKIMRSMKIGDLGFFYHSCKYKEIVGVVRVTKTYHPDPTDPAWGAVDVAYVATCPKPLTLSDIKADPRFEHLALVRQSRLSVMPIDKEAWGRLCRLAGLDTEDLCK